jgi:hypothetical protein
MAALQDISRGDVQNFVNYLLLGSCYVRLGQLNAAISCYSTGIALRPDLPWAYVNRGLAHLDIRDYAGGGAVSSGVPVCSDSGITMQAFPIDRSRFSLGDRQSRE